MEKNGISGNTDDKAKRYRRKYDRLMLIRKKLEVLFDDGKGVIGIFGLGVITIKIINSDENDKFFSHF